MKLGEVAYITKLAGYEFTKYFEYTNEGEIIALRAINIKSGRLDLSKIKKIKKKVSNSLPRSKLYKNDIILSYTGTLGEVTIIEENDKFHLAPNICLVRAKKIDPYYLYCFMKSNYFKNEIHKFTVGSTQKTIPMKNIRQLSINIPEERYIKYTSYLIKKLEKKILLNEKKNEIFEKILTMLFKSWFIDFDPVRAKTEGRITGLSKEISSLFPDSFEVTELGKIPKGWKVKNLNEITSKFTTGLNPRKNFVLGSGENFYITIKNLGDFEIILDKKCDKIDDEAIVKINNRSKLNKNDILFSGIGTIGKVVYVFNEPKNWNISESLFSLRANTEVTNPSFLYYLLKSYPLQSYVELLASGSVQKGIRMNTLKAFKFSLSNLKIQKKFDEIAAPMIEKISINLEEIRNLIEIRDALLPKLTSGELRIPDLRKIVQEMNI